MQAEGEVLPILTVLYCVTNIVPISAVTRPN